MDDPQLARWRREARSALRRADDELVEEVAEDACQRWLTAKAEGLTDDDADARVREDLALWRDTPIPRRVGRPRLLTGATADVRYAIRSIRAKPMMTVAVVLLMAVAVAATTTAFAIAYGVLWRPLTYPESDRLAVLWQMHRGERSQISYPDYTDLAALPVFDGAAAMMGGRASLRVGESILRVNAIEIEARGFALLGARPLLGRLLAVGDAGQPVAMISHRLWTNALHADPEVIGHTMWLSGRTYTIAGVLERGFDFELPITPTLKLEDHDVWSVLDPRSPFIIRRDASTYEAIARLAPGTRLEDAQRAVDVTGERLARSQASTNAERGFSVVGLKADLVKAARPPLLLACGAAGAALLIALGNLITLTLVRRAERQTELAVRTALGAGAWRLRRQLFIEHLVVATIGSAAGVVVATRATAALVASEAAALPRVDAIRFDWPVQLVAAATTLVIAVVLALCSIGSGSLALHRGDRTTTRRARRARVALVTGEVALALALSVGGALVGLSFVRLFATDPGFAPAGVAVVRMSAFQPRYAGLPQVEAYVADAIRRVTQAPGVLRAAAGSSLPLSGQSTGTGLAVEGRPTEPSARQLAGWQFVTPGYFDTLGMRLVKGRDFNEADRRHEGHVTILNETLARTLFPAEDPIGKRITTGGNTQTDDWHTIIGVVSDVHHHALDQAPEPRLYDLFGQHWGRTVYILARAKTGEGGALLTDIRAAIRQADAEAVVFDATTMTSLVDRSAAPYRLAAALGTVLALAAVVLALVGVYAVTAASVTDRTREIGVRAALGASPRDLVRMILREGAAIAAIGTAAGLAGAVVASRLLHSQLFGVRLADVTLLIPVASAAVLAVAIAATLPAALRASRLDPLLAMRND